MGKQEKKKRSVSSTEEEKQLYEDYFHKGLSAQKTGEILNRSKTTILNHWKKVGLKRERLPQSKVDYIKDNHKKPLRQLVDATKLSDPTVRKVLREAGFEPVREGLTDDAKELRAESMRQDYRDGVAVRNIAEKHSLSESHIRGLISKEDKEKYGKLVYLTDDMRQYIIDNYYLKTSTSISEELGVSRSNVLKVWLDNGLKGKDKSRQYYCNFDFFEEINTQEKAYFLGFIMADGCLFQREGHQDLLSITLHKQDVETLEWINTLLESDYPISTRGDYITLAIVSDKLCADLLAKGVKPRKTWGNGIRTGRIPCEFWLDYVFGFFDGDGSIGKPCKDGFNSTVAVGIVGNRTNMSQISYILKHASIKSRLVRADKRKYTGGFCSLILTNMTAKYCFLKAYLSRDYKPMSRKVKRAEKFIYKVENNLSNRSENIKAVEYYNENVSPLL